MYMEKILATVYGRGLRCLSAALACAVGVAFAQNAPADPPAQPAPAKAAPAQPAPAAPAPAAAAAPAQDQRPSIGDIEIRAGARGMILFINGSGPIAMGGGKPEGTAKYPELRVTINNARSGLGPTATFKAPDALPVKEIIVTEAGNGVSLVVKMRGLVNGPVDIRGSGNQVRILLTKDAQPEMVWSATKGTVSAPKPAAAPAPAPGAPAPAAPAAPAAAQPAPPAQPAAPTAPAASPPKTPALPAKTSAAPQIAPKSELPAMTQAEANIKPTAEVTKQSPDGGLVRYKVFGRDPFIPLVRDTSESGIPRVENLRLVGVLEDTHERIALVEDFKNGNRAFALRTNDAVESGKVLRVHRDKVVFLIRDFDVSHSYTLGLSDTNRK